MSLSQLTVPAASLIPVIPSHIHVVGDACPLCDQPIPHERFEEIQERLDRRREEHTAEITKELTDHFQRDKSAALERARQDAEATLEAQLASARDAAEIEATQKIAAAARANEETRVAMQARIEAAEGAGSALQAQLRESEAEIEKMKQDAEVSAATIREEERLKAAVQAEERIAEVQRTRDQSEADLRDQIQAAQTAASAAQQSREDLVSQLDQVRRDSEAAITKIKQDSEASEAAIRAEAKSQADAAALERIAALEHDRMVSEANLQARIQEAEGARAAATEASAGLQACLDQLRIDHEVAIQKERLETDAKVSAARQEASTAIETAMYAKIAEAEAARAEAEQTVLAAQEQNRLLQETHNAQLEQRLQEQREALESAQMSAVNAEKAAAYEKELRLTEKIADLQRWIDNKTAEELGEGAELDLYEVLKGEFEGDKIARINKGQPGADIQHIVIHNGRECGSIIYDSKNHNAWRNDFVTKLAADQMAARADHAILSTRKFPAGTRQLHVQDGVILAAPSRVAALVEVLRRHIVSTHTLRLSDQARTQKTAALYSYISSERFRDVFGRIDSNAEKLLELQVKEKKAHEAVWKSQGELIRASQKVHAEIANEIDLILTEVGDSEQAVNE